MSGTNLDAAIEARKRKQRIVNAYHRVFNSEDGKTILADLAAAFGWEKPAFLNLTAAKGETSYCPIHAAKRDGQRDIKLHIEAFLRESVNGDANIKQAKPATKTE